MLAVESADANVTPLLAVGAGAAGLQADQPAAVAALVSSSSGSTTLQHKQAGSDFLSDNRAARPGMGSQSWESALNAQRKHDGLPASLHPDSLCMLYHMQSGLITGPVCAVQPRQCLHS